ncbi:MAG: type 4a pilus biogenesis protein PilO [Pseudomonadales bacterium]|nr:type 4a pilus biogenesis protein PilO [Pseudomonadales bacterium]
MVDVQGVLDTLNDLDPENIGSWPIPVKVAIWVATAILAGFLVFQFQLSESLVTLDKKVKQEEVLMKEFEGKAFQAANLDRYRKQMEEMENSFGALVRQLPSDTEVPGLLEDISQLGLDSGLEFESIDLGAEKVVEFYAELPIEIKVKGGYHSIGSFISGVAALPRIVTLHDYTIRPEVSTPNVLTLAITAKTYRYNDRSEENDE